MKKYGTCYVICGSIFQVFPYIKDRYPKCYHCSLSEHLPRRCKGGRHSFSEDGLLANCKAKTLFKCAAKGSKNKILRRVGCPYTMEGVVAYVKYCQAWNKHDRC